MTAYTLDPVVVTATRMEQPISKTPASVSVVTAEEIAHKNIRTASEAIAMLPGVFDDRPQGMADTANEISLRGFGENNILVLYDGMPLNDGYSGKINWSAIAIDDIDRIEMVRGAGSSLYGGKAVAGVINIISKNSDQNKVKVYTSYGSNNTWKKGVSVSQKLDDKWSASFGYENKSTNGYTKKLAKAASSTSKKWSSTEKGEAATGAITTPGYNGKDIYVFGTTGKGAAKDETYNAKLKYKFSEEKSLTYHFTHDKFRVHAIDPVTYMRDKDGNPIYSGHVSLNGKNYNFDESDFTDYNTYKDSNLHALQYNDTKNKFKVDLGYTDIYANGYSTGSDLAKEGSGSNTLYPSKTYRLDLQKEWNIGKNDLIAGFNYQHDVMDSISSSLSVWGDRHSITKDNSKLGGKDLILSAFVQDAYSFNDQWKVYTGLRLDHYKKYDGYYWTPKINESRDDASYTEVSPKVSFEFTPNDKALYYFSFGHSFNPPRLYQLYRTTSSFEANPLLKPEKSDTFEFGMKHKLSNKTNLNTTIYRTKTKDMISSEYMPELDKNHYVNIEEARRTGIELELTHSFNDSWSAYANYAFEDAKDKNGERIYDIPRHIIHSGVRYDKNKWDGFFDLQYISDRNEPGYVAHRPSSNDAVYTMNMGVNYEFTKGALIGFAVNNLLDRDYWSFYHGAGRSYTLSLSYEF